MIISSELRWQIHNYLLDIPDINQADRRLQIAQEADFPQGLIRQVDWNKQPSDLFVSNLIDRTLNWGEFDKTDLRHALVEYLRCTERFVGGTKQLVLLALLENVRDEINTDAQSKPISVTFAPTPPEKMLEKLIGEPTLLPLIFLEKCLEVSRAVSCIDVGLTTGTGFLVSTDLLITNHHVVPNRDTAEHSIFRFNYQQNLSGNIGPIDDFKAKNNGLFFTSEELDISVLELSNNPGEKWGWISLEDHAIVEKDDRVNIIQHPGGKPKQISFRNNFVEYVDNNIVQYVTHTEPGSSGSPVLNDEWKLIAIHHAGDKKLIEPRTQRRYFRNEGILISAAIEILPPNIFDAIRNTKKAIVG